MNTASIIIADENEGRRNLLANTFEREGYDVTRLGTLAQTEATAGAVCCSWRANGRQGVRLMSAKRLPDKRGFEPPPERCCSPARPPLISFHQPRLPGSLK